MKRGGAVLQDLRFAFRLMARERWFTLVAVVALALGIGANATVFTIFQAAMLANLPFRDADRLAMLSLDTRDGDRRGVSYAELEDLRAQTRSYAGLGAFREGEVNISDDRSMPEQARMGWLTANAFDVLAQRPVIGRAFLSGEDRPGAPPVVVLGYRLWRNRYGGDAGVLGRPVRVNGEAATIVGVMPEHVRFPISAELWTPFVPTAADQRRDARNLSVFARLREGVSFAEARVELAAIAQRFATAYPETNKELTGARVETFTERFVGGAARPMFFAMMGAVSFVLLIACANVANLLLSRSIRRAREVALRMALGATRRRVLGQLLTESVVLGVIGGVLGLLIAMSAVPLFDASVQDPGKPFWIVFAVNYRVVGYVAAVCLVTGVLFGFAPALHVSRTHLNDVLNEGGRSNASAPRVRWFSGALVVVQIALTCVLLVGAGLMIRSFINAMTLDVGMPTDRLMAMRLALPPSRYETPEARRLFFEKLEPRVSALPGVEGSTIATRLPIGGMSSRPFEVEGRPPSSDRDRTWVATVSVGARYFEVTRTPVVRGRAFVEGDGAPGAEAIVIDARIAARYFPGEDPLGRRLRFLTLAPPRNGTQAEPPSPWHTIVGISPTEWRSTLRHDDEGGVVYLPTRGDLPAAAFLLVRSALPPASVMDAVRRAVVAIDPDQPVFTVQTLDQHLSEQRWPMRVFGVLFGVFAVIALVLSSVGLYAVIAYAVNERTQEIGVRMALGAEARQVRWLVLRRGLAQLAVGLTLGLSGALAFSRVLRRSLVGVDPSDPVTFAAIALLLSVVAIAACLGPARRATRIDPLDALRSN
jgi:putative ABC transport system permease protein